MYITLDRQQRIGQVLYLCMHRLKRRTANGSPAADNIQLAPVNIDQGIEPRYRRPVLVKIQHGIRDR